MKKAVVVDDNQKILTLISKTLEKDFDVFEFNCPLEALHFLKENKVDIAILDIQMPEINGFELCSQIKQLELHQSLPIIIVSAKSGSYSRSLAYKLGAINYIEKPFEVSELRAAVESMLVLLKNKDDIKFVTFNEVTLDPVNHVVMTKDNKIELTRKESLILELLMNRPSQIFSKDRIKERIPNFRDANLGVIETHISAIRKKIKKTELEIKNIYGEGYKLKSRIKKEKNQTDK